MRFLKTSSACLLIFMVLLALGVGFSPVVRSAESAAVQIRNFAFEPAQLTVAVGTTVVWTNEDSAAHSVAGSGGAFQSAALGRGQTFSFTFTSPGTFSYICGIHPSMRGTIVVSAAADDDVQEFSLIHSLKDLKIYPAKITVKKDKKVKLYNTATDGPHPTVIISKDQDGKQPVFDVKAFDVEPGVLTTIEFTPTETGEFFITHLLHGHAITGKLVVE